MANEQDTKSLLAEIAGLKAALADAKDAKTAAEEIAEAAMQASVQANSFIGNTEEQPTGRTVKIRVCTNPTAREAKDHKWKEIDVPTFYYTLQLPAGAGISLMTNGMEYYHGETYEFDSYQLAEMKSRVARCWDHEKSIHGDNENAYRRPQHMVLSGKRTH